MNIRIDPAVVALCPALAIGIVTATGHVRPADPSVDAMKARLPQRVDEMGLDFDNYTMHPAIAAWRQLYGRQFRVKPSAYRCSLEALVKRIVRGGGLPGINNVVDLYNCCSVESMLPMGALDFDRVSGSISLRFGIDGEEFLPLGSGEAIAVAREHIVYADDRNILTWLWNHRDSRLVAIDDETRHAIFFVDAYTTPWSAEVGAAGAALAKHLEGIGFEVKTTGVLTPAAPSLTV